MNAKIENLFHFRERIIYHGQNKSICKKYPKSECNYVKRYYSNVDITTVMKILHQSGHNDVCVL